jgi:Flp pilus assembly protein TadG
MPSLNPIGTIMKMLSFKSWKKNESGFAAVESALILPIIVLLYFGMLDLTKLIGEHRKVATLAGTVADLVGQHRNFVTFTGSGGDLADYFKVAPMVMKPQTDANIRIRVTSYRNNAGTPEIVWSVNNGKGSACTEKPTNADIIALTEGNKDVVLTQVCTDVQLYYSHILEPFFSTGTKSEFEVEQFVMITPRISKKMECYTSTATTTGNSTCAKTG